tara:strand:+ start:123 stop:551 length:429 start_codon:yes stop_codon:yes gene_type:complete
MKFFKKVSLILLVLTGLTGCETRSKLVAKNVYSKSSTQLTIDCKNSIKSVELRQITKNSSLALMPVAAILSGGLSVVLAATVNGGITLDDELNANRIAANCEMQQYQKNNNEILATMVTNSTVSALTGSVSVINAPVQPTFE